VVLGIVLVKDLLLFYYCFSRLVVLPKRLDLDQIVLGMLWFQVGLYFWFAINIIKYIFYSGVAIKLVKPYC
jgi:hypothetical protein